MSRLIFRICVASLSIPAQSLPDTITDVFELLLFTGPASAASASITALALNAGTKKAAEWFYLSDASKAMAVTSIKAFEDTSRISLSSEKATFFCSSILYIQGAAAAIDRDSSTRLEAHSPQAGNSAPSMTEALLDAYPAATQYSGFCVQLFPSPTFRLSHAPCEGLSDFPNENVAPGVPLFSLKCLAASDFDWRSISAGYRPGGVSALTSMDATVHPVSAKPMCGNQRNSDLITRVLGMAVQTLFTQIMVVPISAFLVMDVKEICSSGFAGSTCLRFENVLDLFFESFNTAHALASSIDADLQCLLFHKDVDPFAIGSESVGH